MVFGSATRLGLLLAAQRFFLLHYTNNMVLPQPGCATATALAGTVHTLIGISYQGLVAGGNLVAEL